MSTAEPAAARPAGSAADGEPMASPGQQDSPGRHVFRSRLADVTIPSATLPEYVLRRALALGPKPAVVDAASGRSLSYAEVAAAAGSFAAGLAARGFGRGSVLAILAPNIPEYPVLFHGAVSAGGAVTTLNPLYTAGEIAGQLRSSGARWLVTVPGLAGKAKDAAGGLEIIVVGDTDAAGTVPFSSLLAGAADVPAVPAAPAVPDVPAAPIDPAADLAALPYSSGTTGLSKGVMLTHRNLLASLAVLDSAVHLTEDDVALAVLPFFHIYGMNAIMNPALSAGATLVIMARFELDAFLRAIEQHRVTVLYAVPPIINALARHPAAGAADLSSLRWIMSAAAPLDADTASACARRAGCPVFQAYGMTEASPAVTATPPADDAPYDSVGIVLPNTECKIVDPATGQPLGPGQDGELLFRGPQIMRGYLGDPASNGRAFDPEGFYRSGDVGHIDAAGRLFVVDRIKELIKYKGYQVVPAELEAILLSHPAVTDAAVIGLPAGPDGESPHGYVVLSAGTPLDEIAGYVAERVAPYKKLRALQAVTEIPRSATGKILRRVLKEQHGGAGRTGGAVTPPG
jgi:acyl-CoA synthetase (AMP-forming)/AMP-acid ligase II